MGVIYSGTKNIPHAPAKTGLGDQPKARLGQDNSIPTPLQYLDSSTASHLIDSSYYVLCLPLSPSAKRPLSEDLTNRADATALSCTRTALLTLAVDVGFSRDFGLAASYEAYYTLSPRESDTIIPHTPIA